VDAVDLAGIICPNDIRMVQAARGPHLTVKPLQPSLARRPIRRKKFQGDKLLQFDMHGLVDLAHSPFAKFGYELVLPQLLHTGCVRLANRRGGAERRGIVDERLHR